MTVFAIPNDRSAKQSGVALSPRGLLGALLLGLGFFSSATIAQTAVCSALETLQKYTFAAPNNWPAGATSVNLSFGVGAAAVTVTGTTTTNNLVSGNPVTGQSGGFADSFIFYVDHPSVGPSNTVSFVFNKPINKLQITATDIDTFDTGSANGGGKYQDRVTLLGSGPSGIVTPTAVASSNLITVSGNVATASSAATNSSNCAASSNQCNATFSFAQPINSLTYKYDNGSTAYGNPPPQLVGLADLAFCVQNRDLSLVKTAIGTNFIAGSTGVYSFTVSNSGAASTTAAISVKDILPGGMSFASPLATGGVDAALWSCTVSTTSNPNDTASCTSASSLASGGTTTFSLPVTIALNMGGSTVTNKAKVFGGGDPFKLTETSTGTIAACNTEGVAGSAANAGCAIETTLIRDSIISGRVYLDNNHNSSYEPNDVNYVGAAPSASNTPYLCAQLLSQPGAVLVGSTQLTAAGTYAFAGISAGAYDVRIVLASSSTSCPTALSAPWNPALFGFVATQNPSQTTGVTVPITGGVPDLNFGLFKGVKVSGKVFLDNAGATANDGIFNGADTGVNAVPVCASLLAVTSCSGSAILDSTITDPNGDYTLWVALAASQTIFITNAGQGRISTGASVDNTPLPNATSASVGGVNYTYSYAAGLDKIQFLANPSNVYSKLNFGEVLPAVFTTDDARTVPAGSITLYAHTFIAATSGAVIFSTTAIATPAAPWVELLYLDLNCNGQINPSDSPISAPINVVAGQTLCIIHKETVPAGSAAGGTNNVAVTAAFTAQNNALIPVQIITHTDLTTVTSSGSGALTLLKEVCNAGALPLPLPLGSSCGAFTSQNTGKGGDVLMYRISYTNTGASPVSNVVVQDATPPYTTFYNADAGVLPNSLSACTKITPAASASVTCSAVQAIGNTGGIRWVFSGLLLPAQTGFVTFMVQVLP
jgi:uncharacterized repeat protein (TIGR01451 family)